MSGVRHACAAILFLYEHRLRPSENLWPLVNSSEMKKVHLLLVCCPFGKFSLCDVTISSGPFQQMPSTSHCSIQTSPSKVCESPSQPNRIRTMNSQLLLCTALLPGMRGSGVHGQGHGVWSRLCCGSCGDSAIAAAPLIPIHFSSLITGSVCSPALSPVGAAVR